MQSNSQDRKLDHMLSGYLGTRVPRGPGSGFLKTHVTRGDSESDHYNLAIRGDTYYSSMQYRLL